MSLILFSILLYFFATANHIHGRNCELEIDIEKNCYKQYTENYNYHHFFPVEKSNKKDDTSASVTFFVKAGADAHILLSPTDNQTENDPSYEIILGSANNTASEIRRGHRAKSERAVLMKDAVNRTEWKGYWIRMNVDGSILVGKKDEDLPFLHWKDPKPLPIKFYGFSSWDNTVALWAHQCIRNNESSSESAQQPVNEKSIDGDDDLLTRIGFPTDSEEEPSCQNYTTQTSSYTEYFKIEKPDKTSNLLVNLTFHVLAESNAHILLTSTLQPSEHEPVYEIVLGAANNTMSEIRRMQKAKSKASVKMTDAVSQDNWKVYWIRIDKEGLIQVGREAEDRAFLSWKDPYPLQVKYYSFSTWDNVPTSWKHNCSTTNRSDEVAQLGQTTPKSGQNPEDLNSTKNVQNQTCKIIRTRFFYHEYFPVEKPTQNSDDLALIKFYVQAKSEAHIFLSPRRNPNLNEPGYEIVLGSANNTASEIRRGQKAESKVKVKSPGVVSVNEWRGFWIRVKSTGVILVGKEGSDWPLMYWQDEKPLQINFYSFSSGISSDVLWEHQCSQADAEPLARIQLDEDTPSSETCQDVFTFNYTYTQFFPMEKSNVTGDNFVFVTFQVKADSNAHILLSRTPKPASKEPVYEIVLGSASNIAAEIRKGQMTENRAMKYITNTVTHDEWKGYWIRVEPDGLIMVGNDGEDFPFMYWKDPEPVKIEYYGFSSWLNTTALWKHQCPRSVEQSQKNVTKNCKAFYTQGHNHLPLHPYEKSTKKSNTSFELTFDVKSDNLASVLLSTTPTPTDKEIVYEIILASENNTLSEIRRGQKADTRTMAVVMMTDMTPRNEWKKYWIQILNDGSILVGKVGDELNLPFMRWRDPKPLQIKHYGFSSSPNAIALWQYQCTQQKEQPVQVDSRSSVRVQQNRKGRV